MAFIKNISASVDTEALEEIVAEEMEEASTVFDNLLSPIRDAVPTVVLAVICAVIGFIFIKILLRIIGHALKRSDMDGIAAGFLRSVIKIVLYVILAVVLLSLLHVPMDSVVAVIVSSSMAVALALKDSLANVAGGFILSFAKPIKEGDVIEIDGSKGRVESVGILYTKIVTADNVTVFVPNGVASSSKIINYTDKDRRRIDLKFTIAYENDIDAARAVILETAGLFSEILNDPAPEVKVSAHQDSAVELTLMVWVNTDDYWNVYHILLEKVKKEFDKAEISIPYPQLEIRQR